MRSTLILLVALTIPVLADEPKSNLKEFASKEGKFTVLLPDKPKEVKTDLGDGTSQYQFMVERSDGGYLVSYQDNPNLKNATKEELEKAFEKGQQAAIKALSGKLLREKKITLAEKHPGREYEFEMPAISGIYRARNYLVDGRLYQIVAIGKKEFAASKEADRFLDSFKLTK